MKSDKNQASSLQAPPEQTAQDKEQCLDQTVDKYQKQLRRLTSELSLAEARERREIASDLHDHIGQALAYVSQKVSSLQGDLIFSGSERDFTEILSILDQTITYTRDLTVEISPPVLYDLGLPAAIDWLAERANKRYKLNIIQTHAGELKEISEDVAVFIFKSVLELINNIVKHAQASEVIIHSNWGADSFTIDITDNGNGFDKTKLNTGFTDDCCFGLFSIRERLSYIGGCLSIDSTPGNGTKVSIVAPYQTSDGESDD